MVHITESKSTKRKLLDDSDSDSEDGGAAVAAKSGFKVNEEFARRFEHNKKREDKQRLEEKYKNNGKVGDDDDEESSDDETEDEEGFLATEDLDVQISATLQAIRNKDPRVYDKSVAFYKPEDEDETNATGEGQAEKKEKPLYLKDYHRKRYMAGDTGAFDGEEDDGPKTYQQEQDDLKKSILNEINAAAADGSDEEDVDGGFIKRKEKPEVKVDANGLHPSRKAAVKITELDVANADKNPETFLSNFLSARAWVPEDGSNWKAFESDEGENDDTADKFEEAYNLRFEDPHKSNEFLKSYSRDLAAAKSVRRDEKTGRKRQRELEKEKKEAEKLKRQEEKARLRKLKLDETEKKLKKIKQAAGSAGKELTDEEWMKFLDEAWDDDKWEEEMQKRFGDEYYAATDDAPGWNGEDEDADGKKKKKPKKPKWDDDIDIKDIIPDFENDAEKPKVSLSDVEDNAEGGNDDDEEGEEEEEEEEDTPASKKRKTADHKKERREAQKQAKAERAKLEALVDAKLELDNHSILDSNKNNSGFRYRETSPQSFGLTARDILLAPSDAALNEFAGLKKLATFRDEEKKRKDRKTIGKKARLRQWRREQFGNEFEHTGPTYGFERVINADEVADEEEKKGYKGKGREKSKANDGEDGNVVGDVGERKKRRKRSKGKKTAEA